MFFDDYPRFLETSETAAYPVRLNMRHEAMIESNQDILKDARVLDLASHDGRWSFAALKAGAAHVTGVEARPELVDNAGRTFAEYGVPQEQYEFVAGDMFQVMRERAFDVDVVLCFGFIYHTLRYGELFKGIADATPSHCILDTRVIQSKKPVVNLVVNRTETQSHAAADEISHERRTVAGQPSVAALRMFLDVYGFDVEEQYDWNALLAGNERRQRAAGDYASGRRVTLRCRARDR